MKRIIIISYIIMIFLAPISVRASYAYWIWTPESGRWTNPKYAVKDSSEEQFNWAMNFFEAADYDRAIHEFEKLVGEYPNSKFASKSQYYIGRSQEAREEYYHAYIAYQKAVDTYPYIENRNEILKREYDIGMRFFEGMKAKVLGVGVFSGYDNAIEIFEKVTLNDPYGEYADKAQFKIGETYNKDGRYSEAVCAFQKLIDEYPNSSLVDDARYQVAFSTYKASLNPAYDQGTTDEAIHEFERFVKANAETLLISDADKVIDTLKEKKAKSVYDIAKFYERQRQYGSAALYYKEIVEKYPDASCAAEALAKYAELEETARKIEERNTLKRTRNLMQ